MFVHSIDYCRCMIYDRIAGSRRMTQVVQNCNMTIIHNYIIIYRFPIGIRDKILLLPMTHQSLKFSSSTSQYFSNIFK